MSTPGTPDDPQVEPTLAFDEPAGESPTHPRTVAFDTREEPIEDADREPFAEPHRPEVVVADPARREIRMRTVVLGLVLLVIAGSVLVHQFTDVKVDGGSVLLALMIGGGLLLIAGARRS